MMTNLEANKERIREGMALCTIAHLCRYGELCTHKICSNCEFDENKSECIKEVLSEHKEPIKLKKWEYDLLKCYQETKDDGEFVDHYILKEMQYKGHFQGVDYNLTIEEILENCEVIEK